MLAYVVEPKRLDEPCVAVDVGTGLRGILHALSRGVFDAYSFVALPIPASYYLLSVATHVVGLWPRRSVEAMPGVGSSRIVVGASRVEDGDREG